MLERQREGIAKAQREGKYKGRAPTVRRRADEIVRLKDRRWLDADKDCHDARDWWGKRLSGDLFSVRIDSSTSSVRRVVRRLTGR